MKIGDLAGIADGDAAVQIRIDALEEGGERIVATVTACGDFFSARRLTGAHSTSHGFVVGEVVVLERKDRPAWVVIKPSNRPWHVLQERGDSLIFEHYR
jgi:hypothetical protein